MNDMCLFVPKYRASRLLILLQNKNNKTASS